MLGTLGFNPIKYVISAVAYVFQAVGIAIKNSFGIKPLTRLIVAGVESIKEAIETYVRGIKLERHLAGPQPHQDAHHSPSFFHEQGHNARVEGVHDDEPQPESP